MVVPSIQNTITEIKHTRCLSLSLDPQAGRLSVQSPPRGTLSEKPRTTTLAIVSCFCGFVCLSTAGIMPRGCSWLGVRHPFWAALGLGGVF